MKASEMIKILSEAVSKFGDKPIFTPPHRIVPIDKDGCETENPAECIGFYLES